jgi:hypothetical protein
MNVLIVDATKVLEGENTYLSIDVCEVPKCNEAGMEGLNNFPKIVPI